MLHLGMGKCRHCLHSPTEKGPQAQGSWTRTRHEHNLHRADNQVSRRPWCDVSIALGEITKTPRQFVLRLSEAWHSRNLPLTGATSGLLCISEMPLQYLARRSPGPTGTPLFLMTRAITVRGGSDLHATKTDVAHEA